MIDKIDTNQPMIESGLSSGQPKPARAIPNNDADVSVQVDYASLIDKAVQEPEGEAQPIDGVAEPQEPRHQRTFRIATGVPGDQVVPWVHCSRFQMGAEDLSRSIRNRQASKA